ncbi:AraC family transcriptional regulator [Paucibacter sp. DJ2R-2]|uniref:AraC family transcriptional regulator n=1 Tax=Paucibacter sp. DJ2R-2 TaxID=2893558 RepID=UPI0021E480FB|nr:AraC family transcriptional regulator [Paucibacter sp. DJ2R-2]MCV2419301.1 AraC family transcriptional regulator [Paucibacter sp. DJ4R-1]MCV2437795.1 AraC family transcriptional regulator [Paucibacter sp. DJ2R-2]
MPTLPRSAAVPVAAPPSAAEQALLFGAAQTALLFDGVPGYLFVVKDRAGRYVSFNQSLQQRLGLNPDEKLHGRRAAELWPADLAVRYREQDDWVLARQQPLLYQLDPILLPDRQAGWCVTHKYPLCSREGELAGLLCLSRDVPGVPRGEAEAGLVQAVDRMTKHSERRVLLSELAEEAGLSPERLSALVKRIYGLSPMAFILRSRVRAACALLRGSQEPLLDVALACGFYDQAQFSRQFKSIVGMAPSSYRQQAAQVASGAWFWEPPGL